MENKDSFENINGFTAINGHYGESSFKTGNNHTLQIYYRLLGYLLMLMQYWLSKYIFR